MKDSKIIAAAEEERFTRKKHDTSFPINAAEFCLKQAGITVDDLNHIGFYEKPIVKFERILSQHLQMFPRSFWSFYKALPSWLNEKLRIPTVVRKKLKYKGRVMFIPHHLSHASSCFLVSPFKKAAIYTVDGVGEWSTSTLGYGEDNNIKLLKEITFPDSLGLLYSTVTAFLGFSVNNSEYKVMGLSPYGNPRYYDKFLNLIKIKDDGSFKLNMSYFDYHYKLTMPSKKFVNEFGQIRKPETQLTQHHKDIAASLQKVTEEVILKSLNYLYDTTKIENLAMAGGVALNSVANGKILQNTKFKNIWIQPAATDAGGSLGVAAYITHKINKVQRKHNFDTAYLGPEFTTKEIKDFLDKNNIKYTEFNDKEELVKKTARLIFENDVVGWFQGRMEWGPRALGSRSILSNPTNPKMKEILNLKVKHREYFRPFAPVVTLEDANKWFELNRKEVPYMLFVYPIKQDKQKQIPAVTHVDGSGRLQTISQKQNPLYYDVIKEFEKLSKVPILINTSFNIRGEPIVCQPKDAYRCMMGTGIDYLVIDKFLVKRSDNPKDVWDSESIAKD